MLISTLCITRPHKHSALNFIVFNKGHNDDADDEVALRIVLTPAQVCFMEFCLLLNTRGAPPPPPPVCYRLISFQVLSVNIYSSFTSVQVHIQLEEAT